MMTYIYENPWPLILVLAGIAVAVFMTGSSKTGAVAIICFLASVGLYLLAEYLVSPREEVQMEMTQMLDNFKSRNLNAITNQISDHSQNVKDIAARGLELVELSESFHIKQLKVTLEDETTAVAFVRANGFVSLHKHQGGERHVATYWRTVWKKENGQWKLTDVARLNVTTGEEQDHFSAAVFPIHQIQNRGHQFPPHRRPLERHREECGSVVSV